MQRYSKLIFNFNKNLKACKLDCKSSHEGIIKKALKIKMKIICGFYHHRKESGLGFYGGFNTFFFPLRICGYHVTTKSSYQKTISRCLAAKDFRFCVRIAEVHVC